MEAVEQLDKAVSVALQPADAGLKEQALQFISQVQNDAASWVVPALEIVGSNQFSDPTQFCALDIVERCINTTPDDNQINLIRSKIWERVGAISVDNPKHIVNKLALVVKTLFVRLYPTHWPSFFVDFQQLVENGSQFADLYISVLLAIHQEIGDQLFARSPEEAQRASALKDAVRDNDATRVAESWVHLLQNQGSSPQLLNGVMNVVSGWVVWTDMGLVLPSVPLIQQRVQQAEVREAAVNALSEILSKKMSPDLKMQLIETINIGSTLSSLQSSQSSSTPEFDETVARLVNSVLFEASHALTELPSQTVSPLSVRLEAIIDDVFPLVYVYLTNEYDDTSVQLIPGVTEYLTFLRRESTRSDRKISLGGVLSAERLDKLRKLLHAVIVKCQFDPDDYDISTDEDEAEPEFEEFRAKLRILQETISKIDMRLFLEVVGGRVSKTLSVFGAGEPIAGSGGAVNIVFDLASVPELDRNDWTVLELALYELNTYSEFSRMWVSKAMKYGGEWAQAAAEIQNTHFLLFAQMILSGNASPAWSHPATQILYMELVHRYAPQFLVDKSEDTQKLLSGAFDFFLKYGVQNRELKVRVRSWYLFYRLLRAVRRTVFMSEPSVPPMVFQAIAPLLAVHVNINGNGNGGSESSDLNILTQQDTLFTSQLYLYEVCGILFAVGTNDAESAELMRQLLSVMFADIDSSTSNGNVGPAELLRIHHNIVALSALAKGYGETTSELPQRPRDDLENQLKAATNMIIVEVLERWHSVQIIRDACRQAFSRILGVLDSKILIEISKFIDVLLQTATPNDISEFLSFLGQLVHKFDKNPDVFEMFTSLCTPLFTKLFSILEQVAHTADVEAEGSTDAQLFRRDIVQNYVQFVYNLVNNGFGAILFITPNEPIFQNIYSSLIHYATNGEVKGGSGSPANQKTAVTVLTRMVTIWGPTGSVPESQFAGNTPVPIFSSDATYNQLTELCWTLPAAPSVKFSDAQTRMVVTELAGLQKIMWEVRGASYQTHLAQYLSSAGLEPASVEEFVSKLNAPPKDFKQFFYQFLKNALGK